MKTPKALVIKFQKWVDDIEKYGLEEVRKVRVGMTIAQGRPRGAKGYLLKQKMACGLRD